MSKSLPREVTSNQAGVHDDLIKYVQRHKKNTFKRPIAEHTRDAFAEFLAWLDDWKGELIIDACCGVGQSTVYLAQRAPQAKVVGIDKSVARLDKHHSYSEGLSNYRLFQADLNDFWRLLADHLKNNTPAWSITQQYILYPNPYPKKSQLGKRWHASALMPSIVEVCEHIELRSNWRVYLEEFLLAAQQYGLDGELSAVELSDLHKPSNQSQVSTSNAAKSTLTEKQLTQAITPFERKYVDAGQTCFKLVIRPSGKDKK